MIKKWLNYEDQLEMKQKSIQGSYIILETAKEWNNIFQDEICRDINTILYL